MNAVYLVDKFILSVNTKLQRKANEVKHLVCHRVVYTHQYHPFTHQYGRILTLRVILQVNGETR